MEQQLNLAVLEVLGSSDPSSDKINIQAVIADKHIDIKLYNALADVLINDPTYKKIPIEVVLKIIQKNIDDMISPDSLATNNLSILFTNLIRKIMGDLASVRVEDKFNIFEYLRKNSAEIFIIFVALVLLNYYIYMKMYEKNEFY